MQVALFEPGVPELLRQTLRSMAEIIVPTIDPHIIRGREDPSAKPQR